MPNDEAPRLTEEEERFRDEYLALLRRRRAARYLLRKRGETFEIRDPKIDRLAAELSEEEIITALAEAESERAETAAADRLRRQAENMRLEGRR